MADRGLARTKTGHTEIPRARIKIQMEAPPKRSRARECWSDLCYWFEPDWVLGILFFGGFAWLWVGLIISCIIDPDASTSFCGWVVGTSFGSMIAAVVIAKFYDD